MKKKIFNVTIGGYYVVSIILGVAMALTISMAACDLWFHSYEDYKFTEEQLTIRYGERDLWFHGYDNYRIYGKDTEWDEQKALAWKAADAKFDSLEMSKMCIPLYFVGDELYSMPGTAFDWEYFENYIPIFLIVLAVAVVFLSVMIMEGKSANKAWRQKILQATAIAILIILFAIACQCAEGRMRGKWSYFDSMHMYSSITTWHILAPIVLLIIPLLILKKTRIRKEGSET